MNATTPNNRTYCGVTDLRFNDQAEQVNARIPSGPETFTPSIARLSQSRPRNLPEQDPENGQAARASNIIDTVISSHSRHERAYQEREARRINAGDPRDGFGCSALSGGRGTDLALKSGHPTGR